MSVIQNMMSGPQQMNRMGGQGFQQNPMMQMIMQMMQMMMQMMQQQMGGMMGGQQGCGMPGMDGAPGGGGFSPMQSPGFGGGSPFGGGQGGGMPGMGGGNPLGNFMGQGGAGNAFPSGGTRGASPGGNSGRDHSYVPGGNNSVGGPPMVNGQGQGSNAVRWALSQEGVSESRNPGTVRGYSRGRWQPWCADFVSQSLAASGGSAMGHQSSVQGILNWGRQNNRFMPASAAQANPSSLRPGDVVVWKSGGKSHVGLFTGMNRNGTFNTIEGNTGDAVRRRTHSFGNGLTGFVRAARS